MGTCSTFDTKAGCALCHPSESVLDLDELSRGREDGERVAVRASVGCHVDVRCGLAVGKGLKKGRSSYASCCAFKALATFNSSLKITGNWPLQGASNNILDSFGYIYVLS